MKPPAEKKTLRRTQVLVIDHADEGEEPDTVIGYWKNIKFHQLKKGDVFRLYDSDKDGNEKPDVVEDDGRHQVCVALCDAQPMDDPDEYPNMFVQSLALRGM